MTTAMTPAIRTCFQVSALLTLALFGLVLPAAAQERVLTPEKAGGFDGVVTQCVSFVHYDFANGMCDKVIPAVEKMAETNGLKHLHLGRTEWGFGTDEYLELPADAGFKRPVWLTFYIRATDKPVSAFLWMSLYEPSASVGRRVLWEDSGIGAGQAKRITNGLSAGLAGKLKPVFQALGEGRSE
ncbi:hypothetical protein [uncultured Roseibium sp.]|uniref:hypothetical protein n=1 Tax=uncultured Roseibium sp. TaxID=1936171 RepID=UPI003216F420